MASWCVCAGAAAGFPADLLDSYPVLKDFRNSVAAVTEITAFYRWVGGAVLQQYMDCSLYAAILPITSANCLCVL